MAMVSRSPSPSLAQEAARTAGQQLDPAQAIEGTAITIDPAVTEVELVMSSYLGVEPAIFF
ncbi:hypothetical protein ACWFR5_15635 [Streptomyces sp. NPDC055092]